MTGEATPALIALRARGVVRCAHASGVPEYHVVGVAAGGGTRPERRALAVALGVIDIPQAPTGEVVARRLRWRGASMPPDRLAWACGIPRPDVIAALEADDDCDTDGERWWHCGDVPDDYARADLWCRALRLLGAAPLDVLACGVVEVADRPRMASHAIAELRAAGITCRRVGAAWRVRVGVLPIDWSRGLGWCAAYRAGAPRRGAA